MLTRTCKDKTSAAKPTRTGTRTRTRTRPCKDKDKDLNLVLKESLRTRTRINITDGYRRVRIAVRWRLRHTPHGRIRVNRHLFKSNIATSAALAEVYAVLSAAVCY